MATEKLVKSIDEMIDQLFAEEKKDVEIEKSIDIAKDSETKADAVVGKAPKGQKDEKRGAGRPKEISDVPETDEDGKRAKDYDAAISEKAKEEDQSEAGQVKESNQIKAKGGNDAKKPKVAPFRKDLSEEEFAEYETLKKAREEANAKELRKAEEVKQEELIKSIIEKTASKYESKIEALEKSLNESQVILKAMANKPVTAKSITNIEALEKSQAPDDKPETFTKSEMLDAAEKLFFKGEITDENVTELENNGYIYDEEARAKLENFLTKN